MLKIPATFFCISLIIYLFYIDKKNTQDLSKAIWLPFIWLLFSDSREFSFWLDYFFNLSAHSESIIEGNLFDRTFNILLVSIGLIVLSNRRIKWSQLLVNNKTISIYLLYGMISIFWSDYPFVSLKRFVKTSGTIIMALIVLSDDRPYIALGSILRRLSIVFLPLSFIFIKYYPELGVTYADWSGSQSFTGVAGSKNSLGAICLVAGIYFSWSYLISRKNKGDYRQQIHFSIYFLIIPLLLYLSYIVNSATSILCMVIAVCIFITGRQKIIFLNPPKLKYILLFLLTVFALFEYFFDVKNTVIMMLGRRPDLTTRTPMWEDILSMVKNPLLGFGFESFWLGDRLRHVQELYGPLIQAHNGYLETYINIGLIGLLLLLIWICSGFNKINNDLMIDYETALLKFCLLVVICLYNWTEAIFYGAGSLWFLFIFSTVYLPKQSKR